MLFFSFLLHFLFFFILFFEPIHFVDQDCIKVGFLNSKDMVKFPKKVCSTPLGSLCRPVDFKDKSSVFELLEGCFNVN